MKAIKQELVKRAGGKCKACGYDKSIWALEFHHRDKTIKSFHIKKIRSINERTLAEIDKCDLLCANCHREKHHEEEDL
jgi:hypothetical protein